MRVFAWLGRWTRGRAKTGDSSIETTAVLDEDRSSMADFVRILIQIDQSDGTRGSR